jgi:hypothetical protein
LADLFTILAKAFPMLSAIASTVIQGNQFVAGINGTGDAVLSGVNDDGGQFVAGVDDTATIFIWHQLQR